MKKTVRIFLTLLLSAVLLVGCQTGSPLDASEEAEGEETLVYYCNSTDTGLLSTPCSLAEEGEAAISEIFSIMQSRQFTDGHSAVPDDVTLDHVAWQEKSVAVYLTGTYPEVGTVEELLFRAALTRTLVQFPDVEGISVYVNEEPLTDASGVEIGVMQAESFLTDVSASPDEEELELTLYFINEAGDGLAAETVEVTRSGEETAESLVMKQLIAGPTEAEHQAVLPANTGLLSVQVKDQICYVNLDSVFLDEALSVDPNLVVYAMVNSLTELDDVEMVQFTMDGSADVTLGDSISFASPFERNTELIKEE
ncbi:MAG: GerMN domain-containing protein [Lachnospiraceae bacterium]|nr:GerMN domain-containing protein [Lachnospiraceae bacterium]